MTNDKPAFVVRGTSSIVEAWSVKRLPFEPKDWLLDLRAALRVELANLDRPSRHDLRVVYSSADMSKCDVENACLYNVGLSAFRALGTDAICVERAYDLPPPAANDLAGSPAHYYRYELTSDAHPKHWQSEAVVASWRDVELASPLTPAGVWWAMRQSSTVKAVQSSDAVPLGITVRIGSPAPARSLVQVMKVVLDGVISAFHRHSGDKNDEASKRLAASLDQPYEQVHSHLANTDCNVLGERVLIWPFRSGLQWNPADDRLVAIRLEAVAADRLTVSGELYEVKATP